VRINAPVDKEPQSLQIMFCGTSLTKPYIWYVLVVFIVGLQVILEGARES